MVRVRFSSRHSDAAHAEVDEVAIKTLTLTGVRNPNSSSLRLRLRMSTPTPAGTSKPEPKPKPKPSPSPHRDTKHDRVVEVEDVEVGGGGVVDDED